jgi:membrane protease subunit HflK
MDRKDEPEVNLEQVVERIRSVFRRFRIGGGSGALLTVVVGAIGVIVAIWGVTGFYQVSSEGGERAILRLFGEYNGDAGPGLHWFWPSPIGKMAIVRTTEVKLLELGLRGDTPVPEESLMITGDINIVDAQLLVQYDIKNARDFLFRVVDPAGITIKDATETALRQVVGEGKFTDILTGQKEIFQQRTHDILQGILDAYHTGINVREVKLQLVRPPEQVQPAFDEVIRAIQDKERIQNEAEAFKADVVPRAEGQAARMVQEAEAERAQLINRATGEAERFKAILSEYEKAREVTRQRMYLDAMEDLLPAIKKVILEPGSDTIVVIGGEGRQVLPIPMSPSESSP